MSRPEFEWVSSILEIWKIAVQTIMFIVLWRAVFPIERKKKEGIGLVLFAASSIGAGLLAWPFWARYAVSVFLALGYCLLCHRKHFGKAVFISLVFYNFHSLSCLIAAGIYTKTLIVLLGSLDASRDGFLEQTYLYSAFSLCLLLFFYTLFFALMGIALRKLIKRDTAMEWQDVMLLSVLNFVGGMMANVVMELLNVETGQGVFSLFYEKPDFLWKMPMIAVLMFAGEAALLYFWQRNRILLVEKRKHFVEEQQVRAMKKRLEEAENFYGGIRKVRHEMKNHMANIRGLAGAGQYEAIEEYIRKMDETMQELEYKYTTGNAVTDVILNDKCRRAEKAGIRFEADFRYGGEIPVFDLGIILNNLLDNAIEACEKLEPGKSFIRLALKQKGRFLLLDVENSFDGKASMGKGSSIPPTTKRSALPEIVREHGIGLENVRDMAERYLGGVNIKVKGDVFHVTVMLQQKEKKDR